MNTPMNTIEDIEIYTKNLNFNDMLKWLSDRFEQVDIINQGKVVHDLEVYSNGCKIPVMVTEKAFGKAWASIWFKIKPESWSSDKACAQDINQYCQCRVRFNASPWQQGENMDEWCQLDEQGKESLIEWPNQ
ncbi:hypothetical protein [Endozoicomonas sp. Mp262]|uniref:hypothetical protein n=1 Tax=Endozoicomonas sp. Mp262 TaxID=2919499 RepID=UPI0021E029DA